MQFSDAIDPATASFTSSSVSTSLLLDFGSLNQNQAATPPGVSISNLPALSGFMADLELLSIVSGTGNNPAVIGTNLTTFTNLTAGSSNAYTAPLRTTSSIGLYENVYTLNFQSRSGTIGLVAPQTATLTVRALIPVPEPATLAICGVGGAVAFLAYRRRRRVTA